MFFFSNCCYCWNRIIYEKKNYKWKKIKKKYIHINTNIYQFKFWIWVWERVFFPLALSKRSRCCGADYSWYLAYNLYYLPPSTAFSSIAQCGFCRVYENRGTSAQPLPSCSKRARQAPVPPTAPSGLACARALAAAIASPWSLASCIWCCCDTFLLRIGDIKQFFFSLAFFFL